MIYYVEDNEGIRNLVTYTLNMTGFEAQASRRASRSSRPWRQCARS